jgi:hypothetical protein
MTTTTAAAEAAAAAQMTTTIDASMYVSKQILCSANPEYEISTLRVQAPTIYADSQRRPRRSPVLPRLPSFVGYFSALVGFIATCTPISHTLCSSGGPMIRKKLLILILAIAAFALGLVASLRSETTGSGFDSKLSGEFLAGFGGDAKSLDSAMKHADEALAGNSKDADAMVWHGAGVFFRAGQAFQAGDMETGMDLYRKGLAEMGNAVDLEPDNIGVRALRGGLLLQATLHMEGNPETGQLVELALSDYEHLYGLQKSHLDSLPTHGRGELLFGIADANHRLGNDAKAKEWFQRVSSEVKGSSYQTRADIFLKTGSLTVEQSTCGGCHNP